MGGKKSRCWAEEIEKAVRDMNSKRIMRGELKARFDAMQSQVGRTFELGPSQLVFAFDRANLFTSRVFIANVNFVSNRSALDKTVCALLVYSRGLRTTKEAPSAHANSERREYPKWPPETIRQTTGFVARFLLLVVPSATSLSQIVLQHRAFSCLIV